MNLSHRLPNLYVFNDKVTIPSPVPTKKNALWGRRGLLNKHFVGVTNWAIGLPSVLLIFHSVIFFNCWLILAGFIGLAFMTGVNIKNLPLLAIPPDPIIFLCLHDGRIKEFFKTYQSIVRNTSTNQRAAMAAQPAHQALLEVASLLEGRKTPSPSEAEYVRLRLECLNDIYSLICQEEKMRKIAHREENEAISQRLLKEREAEEALREAVVNKMLEFEEKTGLGSLPQLRSLVDQ